jgi:uncharacterized damage-inducible protein DinB
MIETVAPLAAIFGLNTRLFLNALDGMDEAVAGVRPSGRTNSVAFVAGHLVETRAWMGRYLGLETPAPFGGALEHAVDIDDIKVLPALAEIRPSWEGVSRAVASRLDGLTVLEAGSAATQRFPGVPETTLGGIAFLVQHESYHVGQLALLRKYLGLPSMSYR